jgi:transposase-like protein
MGIVVTKKSIRALQPYQSINCVDETEHHTIKMEMGQTNGVSSVSSKKFSEQRWNQMFSQPKNNRQSSKRNGQQVRPAEKTSRR